MLIENCLLSLATEKIKTANLILQDQTLCSLHLELTLTLNLMEAYLKTRDSIYWRNANKATTNRVNHTLNKLFQDIKFHVHNSKALFNQFCSEQERLKTNPDPKIWASLKHFKRKFQEFESFLIEEYEPTQLTLGINYHV